MGHAKSAILSQNATRTSQKQRNKNESEKTLQTTLFCREGRSVLVSHGATEHSETSMSGLFSRVSKSVWRRVVTKTVHHITDLCVFESVCLKETSTFW